MPGLLRAYASLGWTTRCTRSNCCAFRLPLVTPFRTRAAHDRSEGSAPGAGAHGRGAVGWGECTAAATPEYDGETIDGAPDRAARITCSPARFAGESLDGRNAAHSFGARPRLECALLDARLRAEGISLFGLVGRRAGRTSRRVFAVGLVDDLALLPRHTYLPASPPGTRRVKLQDRARERRRGARGPAHAVVGPDVQLAADANGTYTLEDARRLFARDRRPSCCSASSSRADRSRSTTTPRWRRR